MNLEMLDKGVKREVLKFVLERYGHNKEWKEKMCFISTDSVCRMYFREYVNWEDYKKGVLNENKRKNIYI